MFYLKQKTSIFFTCSRITPGGPPAPPGGLPEPPGGPSPPPGGPPPLPGGPQPPATEGQSRNPQKICYFPDTIINLDERSLDFKENDVWGN